MAGSKPRVKGGDKAPFDAAYSAVREHLEKTKAQGYKDNQQLLHRGVKLLREMVSKKSVTNSDVEAWNTWLGDLDEEMDQEVPKILLVKLYHEVVALVLKDLLQPAIASLSQEDLSWYPTSPQLHEIECMSTLMLVPLEVSKDLIDEDDDVSQELHTAKWLQLIAEVLQTLQGRFGQETAGSISDLLCLIVTDRKVASVATIILNDLDKWGTTLGNLLAASTFASLTSNLLRTIMYLLKLLNSNGGSLLRCIIGAHQCSKGMASIIGGSRKAGTASSITSMLLANSLANDETIPRPRAFQISALEVDSKSEIEGDSPMRRLSRGEIIAYVDRYAIVIKSYREDGTENEIGVAITRMAQVKQEGSTFAIDIKREDNPRKYRKICIGIHAGQADEFNSFIEAQRQQLKQTGHVGKDVNKSLDAEKDDPDSRGSRIPCSLVEAEASAEGREVSRLEDNEVGSAIVDDSKDDDDGLDSLPKVAPGKTLKAFRPPAPVQGNTSKSATKDKLTKTDVEKPKKPSAKETVPKTDSKTKGKVSKAGARKSHTSASEPAQDPTSAAANRPSRAAAVKAKNQVQETAAAEVTQRTPSHSPETTAWEAPGNRAESPPSPFVPETQDQATVGEPARTFQPAKPLTINNKETPQRRKSDAMKKKDGSEPSRVSKTPRKAKAKAPVRVDEPVPVAGSHIEEPLAELPVSEESTGANDSLYDGLDDELLVEDDLEELLSAAQIDALTTNAEPDIGLAENAEKQTEDELPSPGPQPYQSSPILDRPKNCSKVTKRRAQNDQAALAEESDVEPLPWVKGTSRLQGASPRQTPPKFDTSAKAPGMAPTFKKSKHKQSDDVFQDTTLYDEQTTLVDDPSPLAIRAAVKATVVPARLTATKRKVHNTAQAFDRRVPSPETVQPVTVSTGGGRNAGHLPDATSAMADMLQPGTPPGEVSHLQDVTTRASILKPPSPSFAQTTFGDDMIITSTPLPRRSTQGLKRQTYDLPDLERSQKRVRIDAPAHTGSRLERKIAERLDQALDYIKIQAVERFRAPNREQAIARRQLELAVRKTASTWHKDSELYTGMLFEKQKLVSGVLDRVQIGAQLLLDDSVKYDRKVRHWAAKTSKTTMPATLF